MNTIGDDDQRELYKQLRERVKQLRLIEYYEEPEDDEEDWRTNP